MRLLIIISAALMCASCEGSRSAAKPDRDGVPSSDSAEEPAQMDGSSEVDLASGEMQGSGASEALVDAVPAEDPRQALLDGVEAGEAGRWAEAVDLFASALAAAPTWAAAHMEMAHALLMTEGDPSIIGQHLAQARLLELKNPRLHYLEGLLMEEQNRAEMAVSAYERAIELRSSLLDARLRLGRLLLQEGEPEEAITHLEVAVRLSPELLPARANLAAAYEEAGRVDDAARQLEAIANLFPDNPFHLQRLASLYERHGREEEAREVMRRADEIDSSGKRPPMRPLPPSRR